MADTISQPAKDEWERMLSGELYVADSPQQQDARTCANAASCRPSTRRYDAFKEREELFHELFGSLGKGGFLEPNRRSITGCNTPSETTSMPRDCIFLDVAKITIGDRVFFGPRVGLYTPYHRSTP